jgi:hypothetical protein
MLFALRAEERSGPIHGIFLWYAESFGLPKLTERGHSHFLRLSLSPSLSCLLAACLCLLLSFIRLLLRRWMRTWWPSPRLSSWCIERTSRPPIADLLSPCISVSRGAEIGRKRNRAKCAALGCILQAYASLLYLLAHELELFDEIPGWGLYDVSFVLPSVICGSVKWWASI